MHGYGNGWIFVRRGPFAELIGWLGNFAGRPVVDNIGLRGTYDVDLKWSPDPRLTSDDISGGVPDFGGGASIFTAVREQLGMKLEPRDHPTEVLVIERIERPTPD